MVTDEQHKELIRRVSELEKKLYSLSTQFAELRMKNDLKTISRTQSIAVRKKDTTKYRLNGQLFCKRRVAYEVVKKYIQDHTEATYEEILEVFPDYIQGSLGVIKPVGSAEVYSNAHKRFFFADEEIIYIKEKPYVICSQWEKKNIDRLLSIASKYDIQVEYINID